MTTVLAGYTVIDLSDSIAGQYCCRLFSDFGARTILVEPPGGSAVRGIGPFDTEGNSLTFFHLNVGKEVAALERPGDAKAIREFLADADVAVVRSDADVEGMRAVNRGCVIVDVSAFGADGPYRDWKAPEIVVQAMSGMMSNNGAVGREPLYGVGNRASYAAGMAAYISATIALFARNDGAGGQRASVDVTETATAMCFPYVLQHIYNGTDRRRGDQEIPAGQVLCRGTWVCIWVYAFRFAAMCETLDMHDCIDDPRFSDPGARARNWDELFAIVQEKVRDRHAEDVVRSLQKARVIAACAYRPTQIMDNPHLSFRDYWERIDDGGERRLMLGPPFRMGKTPRRKANIAEDAKWEGAGR